MTSVLFHCLLHTHLIDLLWGNWTLSFARKLNYAFLLQWGLSNCIFHLAVSYWMPSNKSMQERPCLYFLDCINYAAFAYHLALCNNVCCNIRTCVLFPCPVSVHHALKPHGLLCTLPVLETTQSKNPNKTLQCDLPFPSPFGCFVCTCVAPGVSWGS